MATWVTPRELKQYPKHPDPQPWPYILWIAPHPDGIIVSTTFRWDYGDYTSVRKLTASAGVAGSEQLLVSGAEHTPPADIYDARMGRDGFLHFLSAAGNTGAANNIRIYRLDMDSLSWSELCNLGTAGPFALAQRPTDGVWWVLHDPFIIRVSEAGSILGTTDYGGIFVDHLWHNGLLYALWRDAGNITYVVTVDPATLTKTNVVAHPDHLTDQWQSITIDTSTDTVWLMGTYNTGPSSNGTAVWSCGLDGSGIRRQASYDAVAYNRVRYRAEDGYFYLIYQDNALWTTAPLVVKRTGWTVGAVGVR